MPEPSADAPQPPERHWPSPPPTREFNDRGVQWLFEDPHQLRMGEIWASQRRAWEDKKSSLVASDGRLLRAAVIEGALRWGRTAQALLLAWP